MKNTILVILMCFVLISLTSADVQVIANGKQETFTDLNFFEKLQFTAFPDLFTQFSIIGDTRNCGNNHQPDYTSDVLKNKMDARCDDAGCDYCLIDVYNVDKDGNWLSNRKEYLDHAGITVSGSTAYFTYDIYCCPEDECGGNDKYCTLHPNGVCMTSTKKDKNIPYEYSSWDYCKYPDSVTLTCYYLDGSNNCVSRTYQDSCPPTYQSMPVFTSKSACQNRQSTVNQQQDCPNLNSQSTCQASSACKWVSGTNPVNCGLLITSTLCYLNPRCTWTGGLFGIGSSCKLKSGVSSTSFCVKSEASAVDVNGCFSGQEKCVGVELFNCGDTGTWQSQGTVNGKCGYVENQNNNNNNNNQVCTTGDSQDCTNSNGCVGTQNCVDGVWDSICNSDLVPCSDGKCKSSCSVSSTSNICDSGDKRECTTSTGATGVQTCVSNSWSGCKVLSSGANGGTEDNGFCLSFADSLLNPLTNFNDCQNNTIALAVILLFGVILLMRFL